MNLAIAMNAYRRPEHTARAIRAATSTAPLFGLVDCFTDDPSVSREVFRVANNFDGVWDLARSHVGLWQRENVQYRLFERVFRNNPFVDAILAIEDDCILSPDAVPLCRWFLGLPERDEYLFLALANYNQADVAAGRELDVLETMRIDSPWAWCFTRDAWRQEICPEWHRKVLKPTGWDWSLTYSMAIHRWKALNPVLSRAKNIGRELGENGGAEIFDNTLAKAAVSDGTWGNDFRLVRRELHWGEAWMKDEAEKDGVTLELGLLG